MNWTSNAERMRPAAIAAAVLLLCLADVVAWPARRGPARSGSRSQAQPRRIDFDPAAVPNQQRSAVRTSRASIRISSGNINAAAPYQTQPQQRPYQNQQRQYQNAAAAPYQNQQQQYQNQQRPSSKPAIYGAQRQAPGIPGKRSRRSGPPTPVRLIPTPLVPETPIPAPRLRDI